ncbi:MAG: hypothetical protein FWH29_08770 [Methanobrevibacter sp.]|nr:hypothetical protein [Methanobrevibacter sp.]
MARPIGETPPLKGKDAQIFLKRMEEPPTKKDKEFRKKLDKLASERTIPFSS